MAAKVNGAELLMVRLQRLDPHSGPLLEPTPPGVGWLVHNHQPFKERAMRFYTKNHTHYCGIDLHAKSMDLVRRYNVY